jgi:hypothetical protein
MRETMEFIRKGKMRGARIIIDAHRYRHVPGNGLKE